MIYLSVILLLYWIGFLTFFFSTLYSCLVFLLWLIFVSPFQLLFHLIWLVLDLLWFVLEWPVNLLIGVVWLLVIAPIKLIVNLFVFLVQIFARHWLITSSSVLFFTFFDWFQLLFTGKTPGTLKIAKFIINWLLKTCGIDIPSFIKVGPIQLQSINCNFSIYDILLWLSGKLPNRRFKIALKQLTFKVDCHFIFSNGGESIPSVKIQLNQVLLDFYKLGGNKIWTGVVTVDYINISSPQSSFAKDKPSTRASNSVIGIFGLKMPFKYSNYTSKSILWVYIVDWTSISIKILQISQKVWRYAPKWMKFIWNYRLWRFFSFNRW